MLPSAPTIQRATGCTVERARLFEAPLRASCAMFDITTQRRLAAFFAQVGHESANLARLVENLSYSADRIREMGNRSPVGSRWRSLVPRADALARNPVALGNAAYGGRMGNGPEESGDGYKYRGRALIMNTGKANYEALTEQLRAIKRDAPDFVADPDRLAEPEWAVLAAGAFWHDRGLNALADLNAFDRITAKVNGGKEGAADRAARYKRALPVFAS